MKRAWTPEEEAIVRSAWAMGRGLAEAMERMPYRSKQSIATRAAVMGVSHPISTAWRIPRGDEDHDREARQLRNWKYPIPVSGQLVGWTLKSNFGGRYV